jgi:hypothetical protein
MGISSPNLAMNFSSASLIIGVSSQWVAIGTGESLNIELRLSNISNQLTTLNNNFEVLIDSSENIITELKGIKDGIDNTHLLQWINIYQNYKINKNTKSLRG